MQVFKKNIVNIYGQKGKNWLSKLDQTIEILKKIWFLKDIKPMQNLTYNYVVKGVNKENTPIVIKICCDKNVFNEELKALKYFDGNGAVKLYDYNSQYNALLLQQAIPAIALESLYPQKLDFVMEMFLIVIDNLHKSSSSSKDKYNSIQNWLEYLDKHKSNKIPSHLVKKAIELKDNLLSTEKNVKLLHGDLHLDNILQNQNEWLAIDPKGIIGEVEFEIAAFNFISENELDIVSSDLFRERIKKISVKSKSSYRRIKDWTFVRLILSAVWSVEDKNDPNTAIKLAQLIED